jgi:SNF2 family DNA or RNA helicase
MLLSKSSKKVVINTRDPDRLITILPNAKKFMYKGAELVAVPHGIEEARILTSIGYPTTSPIEYQYKWSGQYQPFKAQLDTAAFLTMNPKAFCLNDMGTGKTLSTLWAFDYLRSVGQVKKMLVISPLSTLERTWCDEVFNHFPHLTTAVLYGSKERRVKMLNEDVEIYLINHDGIKTIEEEINARTDIDVVVVDEIASFRNAATGRWKVLSRICKPRTYVWGLTGTPTPNLPTDAWAQCRLISPNRVPAYFGKFKDMTLKQQGPFKWIPRENATEIVAEAMQPSIRFSRDECVDLPPAIYIDRHVEMTTEQKKAYKDMSATLVMEFQKQEVTAVNAAVKMQKLVQIACGVVYGADDTEVILPNDPRIAVVREAIEEAGTKTIVFVPFKGVLRHVADQLSKDFTVAMISGDTSKAARDDIFHRFQQGKELQVLVAQPAAMSHGLTLTSASTVVWYAPVTSNEVYQQANARITRPGQKHTQVIVNVEASDVERRIYTRLKLKQSLQGLLLDSV